VRTTPSSLTRARDRRSLAALDVLFAPDRCSHQRPPHKSPGSGFATIKLSVPQDQGLRGATLYAQAMVVDPVSPIGLAFTAGRTLVLGDWASTSTHRSHKTGT
jgi:hypothetical protein